MKTTELKINDNTSKAAANRSFGKKCSSMSSPNSKFFIQPKLTINQPNDMYEQEADSVAGKVMSIKSADIQTKSLSISSLQRKCAHCEAEEKNMQQTEFNNVTASPGNELKNHVGNLSSGQESCAPQDLLFDEENPEGNTENSITVDGNLPIPDETNNEVGDEELESPVPGNMKLQRCAACEEMDKMQLKAMPAENNKVTPDVSVIRQSGEPLNPGLRTFFEPRFGYSFGHVQLHTNKNAADSARSVNARAYTVGENIVFGAGQYMPETKSGLQLIAHELTHVIQQRAAANISEVSSTPSSLKTIPSNQITVQRWHVDGPSDASLNTIVCDGSGGVRVQLGNVGNADQTRCLSDCVRQHEGSHRSDALAANANLCRDKADGSQVLMDGRPEQQASEIAASNVEIACLQGRLPTADATCRPIITARITQMEAYRDSFR
jgi:hypothetical protein